MMIRKIFMMVFLLILADCAVAQYPDNETVTVHFFYSKNCPHCASQKPFLEKMESDYPWLQIQYLDVEEKANALLYVKMASKCGESARGVPATFICDDMTVGYGSDEIDGARIRKKIMQCHESSNNGDLGDIDSEDNVVELPFLGKVNANSMSLPLFTLVLGFLDGFNPCAFFVLFFLLSMLIHAKSRSRMLLIGGVFVFISGLIYFVFMAAWLNLFLFIGHISFITTIAGIIALFVGAVNIKDFFWFKKGISLSIPDSAKPRLFTKMRGLLRASSLSSMLFGTVVLAVAANTYELLCTAGFPMVYTRVLTLYNLSSPGYYMYLALYNIVYVIPLMTIVVFFAYTLGSKKLTENEGRTLKLMSGNMMIFMGAILVLAPHMLNNIATAALVLGFSAAITAMLYFCTRYNAMPDENRI